MIRTALAIHARLGWNAAGVPFTAAAGWHTWAAHTPPNTEQEHTS